MMTASLSAASNLSPESCACIARVYRDKHPLLVGADRVKALLSMGKLLGVHVLQNPPYLLHVMCVPVSTPSALPAPTDHPPLFKHGGRRTKPRLKCLRTTRKLVDVSVCEQEWTGSYPWAQRAATAPVSAPQS
jgi:hypothetical protein